MDQVEVEDERRVEPRVVLDRVRLPASRVRERVNLRTTHFFVEQKTSGIRLGYFELETAN